MITNWGYSMPDLDTLPDMLGLDGFDAYTGGKYQDSDRIEAEISAACAAIRNYCGWHLAPSAECVFSTIVKDRRVIRTGPDMLIQLPARVVTAVESVTIGDTEYTSYYAAQNGLLRVFDVGYAERYEAVEVVYTAGLDDDMLIPVKELIAHQVLHSVALPAGITTEASGGVSVTYNAAWINSTRSTDLSNNNKEVVAPYRVTGVF